MVDGAAGGSVGNLAVRSPWTDALFLQYQDNNFAQLSGARIVRIATHPDYTSVCLRSLMHLTFADPLCRIQMGYGAKALEALASYYSGEIMSVDEATLDETFETFQEAAAVRKNASLLDDPLTHRSASSLPPLLQRLQHRRPEALDYLGVSYGLTQSLLRFWKRAGYTPYYVRQTENDITGEFGCVMLKPLVPDIGFEAFAAGA